MILETIGDAGLARLAETDEVWGNAMRDLGDEGDDVAPDIGGGGIAVQEKRDRCVRPARLPIGHLRIEDGDFGQLDARVHVDGSLNTVAKAMRLKRSSGSALRSTFMRRIAPSQEERRNSASSSGANVAAISPAAWPLAMHAAKGERHSAKISVSRARKPRFH
jgi:hypothetical protein